MSLLVEGLARLLAGEVVSVDEELPPRTAVRRSRLLTGLGGRLAGMGGPAAAVTLGRTILVHPSVQPGSRLLRHELAHVAQWRREPLLFPFRYVGAHICHGYQANPYEVEARAAESGSGTTGETP